jgi:hypothetical protein
VTGVQTCALPISGTGDWALAYAEKLISSMKGRHNTPVNPTVTLATSGLQAGDTGRKPKGKG